MNITRRDVLRRLAGVATAASLWASTLFVLDDDIRTSVASRTAENTNPLNATRRTTDIPRRQPGQATTSTETTNTTSASPDPTSSSTQAGDTTTTAGGPDQTTTTSEATQPPVTTQPPDTTQPPSTAKSGRFTIMLRGLDPERFWWDAPYERKLTYASDVGWVDGDRLGYSCAWMFLERGGRLVGRVTFARVPGATYAKVNDRHMDEGARYFDGTLAPRGLRQTAHVSFGDDIVDQAYEEFTGDDQRPTIKYVAGGDLLEVRDYKKTVVENGIKFRQTSASANRVSIVAYENNLPVIVVYYDSLDPSVKLTTDL